ncbi:hypothetical protein F443_05738 [Phytophthora nicotianae P1569]|uniref:SGNH hydrolase-type esterase domain-containing protein n=1 Tax=Phytophthora nicotianae P1569 TaxID=1317065 RepID=V9FK42_PHYNI|nr:hypothetical protein F443_05738 [Phytophthora nicotianae P1569]
MTIAPGTFHGLVILFTLATAFALPVESQPTITVTTETQPASRSLLLLTGDSHTEQGAYPNLDGWVSLLQARYTRSTDIILRGLSGYNAKWFLKYVMPTLENEIATGAYTTPSLITVWLGTNDAVLVNGSNPEMHVPIEEYKDNLNQIVRGFQNAAPDAEILIITPPHIDDDARAKYAAERTDAKRGLVDRSNAATGDYARACVEVASELKVSVLDLYEHFNAMPVESRNTMLADGVHFNAAGYKEVDSQLRSKISSVFPRLTNSLDTWQFPKASKYVAEDPYTANNATESRS